MANAIGMIEFSSIAKGIETCDIMLKAANVSIIKASTICPGKYIIIISGDTGDVKSAMSIGKNNAGEHLVDELFIANITEQLIPAISMTNQIDTKGAVGVIEFYSVTSAVLAADICVKSANVSLVEIKTGYAIGGKGVVILTGEIGAIRAAMENAVSNTDLICGKTIIPRPTKELFETLL